MYGVEKLNRIEGSNHFSSLSQTIGAIADRQKITANNIANAHTPGYTAKDISFANLLGKIDSPFETRMGQQMGSMEAMEMNTGQPVSLQKELIEMQKNILFYNMAVRRISTVITGLKTATQIGR